MLDIINKGNQKMALYLLKNKLIRFAIQIRGLKFLISNYLLIKGRCNMKQRHKLSSLFKFFLPVIILAFFFTTYKPYEIQASPTKLTLNMLGPEKGIDAESVKWWVKEVEGRTKGQVKITIYWGGVVAKAKETIEATRRGLCNISLHSAYWFPSELPLSNIGRSLLGRCREGKQAVNAFHQLMKEYPVIEKEYETLNQKLLISWCNPLYFLSSTKKVENLDGIKGLKFRGHSSSVVTLFNQMGAVGVYMPSTDAFEAMDKGMIQGAMGSMDMCKKYHWYEVSKYLIDIGAGANGPPSWIITINLDTWKSLPVDVQQVMVETGKEFVDEWDKRLKVASVETEKFLTQEHGMQKIKFPEADLAKIHNLPIYDNSTKNWIDDVSAKGYPGEKMLNRYVELLGIK